MSHAPITNAHLSGTDTRLKSGAAFTREAGATAPGFGTTEDGAQPLNEVPPIIKAGNGWFPDQEDYEFRAHGHYDVGIDGYQIFALEEVEGARICVFCNWDNAGNYIPQVDDTMEAGFCYEFRFVGGSWSFAVRPSEDRVRSVGAGGTGAIDAPGARNALGLGNSYSTVTISAAGNTTVSAWGSARRGDRRITVNAFTGVATVTLSTSNATAGDRAELDFVMPASAGPAITARNATSSGTLLAIVPTDAAVARTWRIVCQYNGSAWQLLSLQPQSFVEPLATNLVATLESQALHFDGQSQALIASPGITLGLAPFTVFAFAKPKDFSLVIVAALFGCAAYGPGLTFRLFESGLLQVACVGVATVVSSVSAPNPLAAASYAYTRDSSGIGRFWVNGVQLGATVTDSSNYSYYTQQIGFAYIGGGDGILKGWMARGTVFNTALSGADLSQLCESGGIVPQRFRGASQRLLNTTAIINSGVIPFTSFSGASATGFSATGTGGNNRVIQTGYTLRAGHNYRVSFTGGGTGIAAMTISFGIENTSVDSTVAVAAAGANQLTLVASKTGTSTLTIGGTTAGTVTVSDLSVIETGCIWQMDDASRSNGPVLRDVSGASTPLHLMMDGDGSTIGGVRRASPSEGAQEIGPFDISGTAGNFLVGGVDVQRIPTGYAIVGSHTQVAAGSTGNIAFGTASGGEEIVASVAVNTAGRQSLTVVNPSPVSPARLWGKRSGTLNAGSLAWFRIAPTN